DEISPFCKDTVCKAFSVSLRQKKSCLSFDSTITLFVRDSGNVSCTQSSFVKLCMSYPSFLCSRQVSSPRSSKRLLSGMDLTAERSYSSTASGDWSPTYIIDNVCIQTFPSAMPSQTI